MPLDDRIKTDLTTALKAKDLVTANVLRMLMSAFKNVEIEKKGPLSEEEKLGQIGKAIKVRKEAIEGAKAAARPDLQAAEEAEMKILSAYLPAQMNDEELKEAVKSSIAEAGAKTPAEMGKVMKVLMPKIAGKADGGKASALVKQLLSGA